MARTLMVLLMIATNSCIAQTAPTFIRAWGGQGPGDQVFYQLAGVAVSPTGFVYAIDSDWIRKFDGDGQVVGFISIDYNLGGMGPKGLSIDPASRLHWTAEDVYGRGLWACDSTGAHLGVTAICCAACAECVDDGVGSCEYYGAAVSVDARSPRGLYVLDAQWGTVCGPTVVRSVPGPLNGIAIDPAGSVFVTNGSVSKFAADGSFLQSWDGSPQGGAFSNATAIAADNAGRVYVVDSGNNRIQVFTNDGHFLTSWGGLGSGPGQFSAPNGIGLDSQGNIYIADSGNDRIQKFGAFVAVQATSWSAVRKSYR